MVRALGTRRPSIRVSMVPTRPGLRPAPAIAASSKYDVVVLPDVPVMPTTCIFSEGRP